MNADVGGNCEDTVQGEVITTDNGVIIVDVHLRHTRQHSIHALFQQLDDLLHLAGRQRVRRCCHFR